VNLNSDNALFLHSAISSSGDYKSSSSTTLMDSRGGASSRLDDDDAAAAESLEEEEPSYAWFTGTHPTQCAGFLETTNTLTSLPLPRLDDRKMTRQKLMDYFDNTWTITETLFFALKDESAFYRPPYHHLRHPLIFYYGHPAALYVNKLRVAGILEKPVNELYENIFETGVDEMNWDDLTKNDMRWPTIREVHAYRCEVYTLVRNTILEHPAFECGEPHGSSSCCKIEWNSDAWALVMAFEHERIHIETSSVLFRELPIELVRRPKYFPPMHPTVLQTERRTPETSWTVVPAGSVKIGKSRDFPSYGWDNEYGERDVHVPSFRVSQHYVSNDHFLDFVKGGGYSQPQYWTQDGWKWKTFRNVKWPCFWVPNGPSGLHRYHIRMIFEVVPWNGSLPAIVNAHEAAAYTNWLNEKENLPLHALSSYRLPTESELARIRHAGAEQFASEMGASEARSVPPLPTDALVARDAVMHLTGQQFHSRLKQNRNLAFSSECSVDASRPTNAPGEGGGPVYDIQGNVWQWCLDWFAALPGFRVHRLYDDFSTPCFDGQHNCIFGGSFASTGDEASVYARFHFRPHFYQHAGFRIARSEAAFVDDAADVREIPLTHVNSPPPHASGWDPRRTATNGISLKRMRRSEAGRDGEISWEEVADCDAGVALPALRTGYASMTEDRMLQMHYGTCGQAASALLGSGGSFPRILAEHATAAAARVCTGTSRALEVGCTVGGGTFALASMGAFGSVIGVDGDASCISTAQRIAETGELSFTERLEGELVERHAIALNADKSTRLRCSFRVMDPCCLSPELGAFDVVVVNNVLSRVVSPKSVLGRMGSARGLVAVGGVCVVADTFDWQDELTPRDSWLGGRRDDGQSSRASVAKIMSDSGFELVDECELPMVLPVTSRCVEMHAPCVSTWVRRS